MRCLGLDLGSKTLGIAISDLTNSIASVYTTLNIAEDDYESLILPLKKIILEEDVDTLVLGFPKNILVCYNDRDNDCDNDREIKCNKGKLY